MNMLLDAVLCLLPLILALKLIFKKHKERLTLSCVPFNELQRRPAGEALRIKLKGLDEKLTDETLGLILFPMLMILIAVFMHPKDWVSPVIFFLFSASSSLFLGMRIYKTARSKADYRLGFEGE